MALTVLLASQAARPAGDGVAPQGWTSSQRETWYKGTQGSRLIPEAWILKLEQSDSTKPFLDPENIARYRYLPGPQSPLPLGFAVDTQGDCDLTYSKIRWRADQDSREPWVGMNCAACHTTEITYKGARIRIDGGPTLADFQSFLNNLDLALATTLNDPAKFDRFAAAVLSLPGHGGRGKAADTPANRARLAGALRLLVDRETMFALRNATPMSYGFGRLDAVGYILNKVAWVADPASPTANPPDAPVSYPHLWGAGRQTHVQWDGIAVNTPTNQLGRDFDAGALGRNAGEVIGVFADIHHGGLFGGFPASVRVRSLTSFEADLNALKAPLWPSDVLGPPDPAEVQRGATLYGLHCASCHVPTPRDSDTRGLDRLSFFGKSQPAYAPLKVNSPPKTDVWMACNAAIDMARSGALQGSTYQGQKLAEVAPVSSMLGSLVTKALVTQAPGLALAAIQSWTGTLPPPQVDHGVILSSRLALRAGAPSGEWRPDTDPLSRRLACDQMAETPRGRVIAYKARPLNGIWATAPFLHNGSAPTLYDLLLPPKDRPAAFSVGTREFDPVKVGFVTDPGGDNSFVVTTRDQKGVEVHGNASGGHDYGNAAFTEADRMALIAYLKVIGEPGQPLPQ
jgi:hypothetical protein